MAALASPVLAQTPAADRRIDVTVLDEQGLAVVGARVTATLRAANISRTASSATERFSLTGLTPGVYTLRVSASGFQVQDVTVDRDDRDDADRRGPSEARRLSPSSSS